MDRILIRTWWQDRKETAAECAARAEQLLAFLAQVDLALQTWFLGGRSRKDALRRPVATDLASLEKLCRKGVIRYDVPPRKIVEELGFNIGMWNGAPDDESVGFSLDEGAYETGRSFPNRAMLDLPCDGPSGERLNRLEPVLTLIEGMAKATDALWGVALTDRYLERVMAREEATGIRSTYPIMVCWVTYLAAHARAEEAAAVVCQELPQLPPPIRTADGGVLLVTTRERFDADNPAHVQAAEDLERVLRAHGLLTF